MTERNSLVDVRDVRRALLFRARQQRAFADTARPSWPAHLGASVAYREAAKMLRFIPSVDDIFVAAQVTERLRNDTGERIIFDEFLVQNGYTREDFAK